MMEAPRLVCPAHNTVVDPVTGPIQWFCDLITDPSTRDYQLAANELDSVAATNTCFAEFPTTATTLIEDYEVRIMALLMT
jgi:hypothetical protein